MKVHLLWAVLVIIPSGLFGQGSNIDFTLGTSPGNPSTGKIRLWSNTSTSRLECLDVNGANCMAPAFSIPTPGTAITLPATGGLAICTGTCTVTMPATPATGALFCVTNDVGVSTAITLSGNTGVFFGKVDLSAYGTSGGTMTSTALAATRICLWARDATHYIPLSFNGSWNNS